MLNCSVVYVPVLDIKNVEDKQNPEPKHAKKLLVTEWCSYAILAHIL